MDVGDGDLADILGFGLPGLDNLSDSGDPELDDLSGGGDPESDDLMVVGDPQLRDLFGVKVSEFSFITFIYRRFRGEILVFKSFSMSVLVSTCSGYV